MTETVKNKKKEFGELIQKLESHSCHFGSHIIEEFDIIFLISCHYELKYKAIHYDLLMKFLNDNKEKITYLINKNFSYYVSDISEGIDEDVWNEFGDEILKLCTLNSGISDK